MDLAAAAVMEHTRNTAKAYESDLRCWMASCIRLGGCPVHTSRHEVQRYLQHLQDLGLAATTRARRLCALSWLFQLAQERGLLHEDPLQKIRRPRRNAVVDRAGLTRDEVAALLSAAYQHSNRAHALVSLQALNGLRTSEALSVNIEHIGFSQGHRVINLIGKGGKPALVPLSETVARSLAAAAGSRRTGPVLMTRSGRAMDRRAAARMVCQLGVVASITSGRVHGRALRASFVTHALQAGVPLHVVQDAARHSDPRQTRRYDRAAMALSGHATYTVAELYQQLLAVARPGVPGGQLAQVVRGAEPVDRAGQPVRLAQLVVPRPVDRDHERVLGGEQLDVVEADQVSGRLAELCPSFSSLQKPF